MEDYEPMGTIGEGTYGIVAKCRHIPTGAVVAVKMFKEADKQVRRTAAREVTLLQALRHDNVVRLLEAFCSGGRLYLVFELAEQTVLQALEECAAGGLQGLPATPALMWQLLRATAYLHSRQVVHRDIKPENLLLTAGCALKLCDFGFARPLDGAHHSSSGSSSGDDLQCAGYSDYVATRWYRAPELLVGEPHYGFAVDVWAIGCMLAEMATGQPLFPGESDVEQLWLILQCLGPLCPAHAKRLAANPAIAGMAAPPARRRLTLAHRFPDFDGPTMQLLTACLQMDPARRPSCEKLLTFPFFHGAADWFSPEFHDHQASCRAALDAHIAVSRGRRASSAASSGEGFAAAAAPRAAACAAAVAASQEPTADAGRAQRGWCAQHAQHTQPASRCLSPDKLPGIAAAAAGIYQSAPAPPLAGLPTAYDANWSPLPPRSAQSASTVVEFGALASRYGSFSSTVSSLAQHQPRWGSGSGSPADSRAGSAEGYATARPSTRGSGGLPTAAARPACSDASSPVVPGVQHEALGPMPQLACTAAGSADDKTKARTTSPRRMVLAAAGGSKLHSRRLGGLRKRRREALRVAVPLPRRLKR